MQNVLDHKEELMKRMLFVTAMVSLLAQGVAQFGWSAQKNNGPRNVASQNWGLPRVSSDPNFGDYGRAPCSDSPDLILGQNSLQSSGSVFGKGNVHTH